MQNTENIIQSLVNNVAIFLFFCFALFKSFPHSLIKNEKSSEKQKKIPKNVWKYHFDHKTGILWLREIYFYFIFFFILLFIFFVFKFASLFIHDRLNALLPLANKYNNRIDLHTCMYTFHLKCVAAFICKIIFLFAFCFVAFFPCNNFSIRNCYIAYIRAELFLCVSRSFTFFKWM